MGQPDHSHGDESQIVRNALTADLLAVHEHPPVASSNTGDLTITASNKPTFLFISFWTDLSANS